MSSRDTNVAYMYARMAYELRRLAAISDDGEFSLRMLQRAEAIESDAKVAQEIGKEFGVK